MTARAPNALVYTALALLFSLLWASAPIGMKYCLHFCPPLTLMVQRFLFAGVVLLAVARARGMALPRSRQTWGRFALLGLLNNTLYIGLFATGLRAVSAGTGAVLMSTTPLLLAAVAPFFLRESWSLQKIAGLLLAFLSVVVMMCSRAGGHDQPAGMLLIVLGNIAMVAGTILFKRWAPQEDLLVVTGCQLLLAALFALPAVLFLEPLGQLHGDPAFWLVLLYLVLAVSCGAVLIWFYLLRRGDAARASAFLFLNPVFGVFIAAATLGETLQLTDFIGTGGVAVGILLVQRASR